ncbi:unnamed protein product [Prorocentrum cordatum]|uniref:C3H1-type domain-containing protein n=1 Tax=Prorocentrum cordatum TaxID=2364126 RepID=A0ABN9WB71_9DINO|nr:unnamed protein product [Polarella glacialis]
MSAPPVADPSTPAKQERGLELLPLRVSSPTMALSEYSPSTSTAASTRGTASPTQSQEPIKIQPAAELTSGYGFAPDREPDDGSPARLNLASKLAAPQIILQLASAIEEPELGSKDMPTIGSLGHRTRNCKPCAFLHTKGCENGIDCPFCHLCTPGEKKRRLKEKKEFRMHATQYLALQEQINQEYHMYIPPPR